MFGASDTLFERLAEYLTEKIVGHHDLEIWFDRPLATGAEDSFGLSPDSFPQIITSKSLKNMGGGYVNSLRTIREVNIDAVKAVLEELTAPKQETVVCEIDQMARLKKLMKRSRERVYDLLCMSKLAHASKLKEHDDNDDFQGTTGRAA